MFIFHHLLVAYDVATNCKDAKHLLITHIHLQHDIWIIRTGLFPTDLSPSVCAAGHKHLPSQKISFLINQPGS